MSSFTGTSGDDTIDGTASADDFDMSQGGDDTVNGLASNDTLAFAGAFTKLDRIDGGDGHDVLQLNGDYSVQVKLGIHTLVHVEQIQFVAGHSYNLVLDDANTDPADGYFDVAGYSLGAGDTLTFDGSAETDTSLNLHGGAGDDVLRGGATDDTFDLFAGGNDHCYGGGGTDFFTFEGQTFTRDDRLDGEAGSLDTLALNGDYHAGVHLSANTITAVERITFFHTHSYKLVMNDGNVAAGQSLIVLGDSLDATQKLSFVGAAEVDGSFNIYGGSGRDRLIGGRQDDFFTAGKGADKLTGGTGADTFIFNSLADSKNGKPDTITDLNNADVIDISPIDADSTQGGNQAFILVVGSLTGVAGQAALLYDSGMNVTSLLLDTNGDGVANATVLLSGDQSAHTNFVL